VFSEKETRLENVMKKVVHDLHEENENKWFMAEASNLEPELKENGFELFLTKEYSLIYWSDNSLPTQELINNTDIGNEVVFLGNSWCYVKKMEQAGYWIIGLIIIKYEYPYENNLLHNSFAQDFDTRPSVQLLFDLSGDENSISNNNGDRLFKLSAVSKNHSGNSQPIIPSIFYAIALFLFLLFFSNSFSQKYSESQSANWLRVFIAILFVVRFGMIKFHFPSVFYELELFDPQHFGKSVLFSSLGDFLFNSFFILIAVYFLTRNNVYYNKIKESKKIVAKLIVSGLLIAVFVFFILIDSLVESLIMNSTINFELYRIFTVTTYSLTGYLIISFLLFSFALIADKFIQYATEVFSFKAFIGIISGLWFLLLLITINIENSINIYALLFLLIFMVSAAIIRFLKWKLSYSTLVFFLLIVSMYASLRIKNTIESKEQEIKKVMAVSLATERDPLAETFFEVLNSEIKSDSLLIDILFYPGQQSLTLNEYLEKEYFNAYWEKYDLQLFVCGAYDSILVENSSELRVCRDFFNEMIAATGINVPGSNFFFLDNSNGRISYLGELNYYHPVDSFRVSLFIDLNSKLQKQILGYPELLIEDKNKSTKPITTYSYAKYKDGVLVTQSGEYEYSLSSSIYQNNDEEYAFLELDDFGHLIYRIDKNSMIVVSNPTRSLLDLFILLSYIFVLFHLIFTLVMFFYRFPKQIIEFRFGFKNKIQISMVLVMLLSLVLIGAGTIYFNIKQYNARHYENISEKIQSVLVELEHKLANEEKIDIAMQEYLSYLLVKFSNVFYTDINVYDLSGKLLASSRPGIFENALISTKMNTEAYRQLHFIQKAKFVQEERISDLIFLSAYVPFSNNQNKVLAYLNLPYFAKQKQLKKEIAGLITAIINIYVLLILITILITIFITNKITHPLRLIQEKMNEMRLGKPSEKIKYHSQDEIGRLINDYNRMTEELQKSADLLAKSERESAWREMAKQIAHEIKNPLTPMRLHLQHLQKTVKENSPDLPERFNKISEILITQIDVLSSIATEFSSFAEKPKAKNSRVDLCDVIKKVTELFRKDDIEFGLNLNTIARAMVFVDSKQMQGVFINLIKNGIQAVPDGEKAKIEINIQMQANTFIVEVKDNGSGIPTGIQEKLFQPNFTTKSSGMGLGLAIAKNTIELAGGKIKFKTKLGEGSSFFVELPEILD
ncbi:MAG: ATP-binding protein, partial [Bacteroidota bacterium]|nr:ATP-binding protein [Bacteroidota bacterium]